MSGAWGTRAVGGVEIIDTVWAEAPAGADGDTVGDLVLRLPATGESVEFEDVGLRFDGVRPAALIIPMTQYADDAVRAFYAQCLNWSEGLTVFGPDVFRAGNMYLDSGWQAMKLILADTTTYSDEIVEKIARAAILGAADITSPEAFADSAYAQRAIVGLTAAFLWVDSSGNRVNLSSAVDYGNLTAERPFTLPTSWRTAA